ncbi:Frag1/DRAM/Sfk1 [Lophiotrema nucula]|uniref:Frag1/DRAM/Sfk1 n=1 Tax=Lophiotrema nucula TaxID=690887 RepID=A0A6A5YMF2_9PLEO|nr:Frag1/DRAM/Sfk1 [Lophiotrema nucula]
MAFFQIPFVPLNRLWVFPALAGTAWFITLAGLLLTWIARGTPRYPGQQNPYVAFISDIAAFQLKPFFLTGSVITAFAFIGTLISVHFARYDHRMYGIDDVKWKKTLSAVAMIAGVIAGLGLLLLAIMDTYRFHEEHAVLLLVCFVGLASSMVLTSVVYFDQVWRASPFRRLRLYCTVSLVTVALDVCLGATFYGVMQTEYWRVSGILEWIMAFTGSVYLWAFIGFVSVPEEGVDEAERRALLRQ